MSEATTAYLALGSNIGDRLANLRRACELLDGSGVTIEARSAIYESESVEGGGETAFLNAALRVRTKLTPHQLLGATRQVESEMGRPQPPRQGARLIDIDILLFGDETLNAPELAIPHPRMLKRAFMLRPLCDVLEGGWVRPSPEQWT